MRKRREEIDKSKRNRKSKEYRKVKRKDTWNILSYFLQKRASATQVLICGLEERYAY